MIASLTARANAIKMLHTRIQLIKSYLESLPPSTLTSGSESTQNGASEPTSKVDYPLLRSIQALLSRLPLLLPSSDLSSFQHESLAEKSEVSLVSLLGSVGQGTRDAKELGYKFSIIEHAKNNAKKHAFPSMSDMQFDEPQTRGDPMWSDTYMQY